MCKIKLYHTVLLLGVIVMTRRNKKLQTGEYLRSNGTYEYRYTDIDGKRKSIYAKTLSELRLKENNIDFSRNEITVNELYEQLCIEKTSVWKKSSKEQYRMCFNIVKDIIGDKNIADLNRKYFIRLYKDLHDKKGFSKSRLKYLNIVLGMIFKIAIRDEYILKNPLTDILNTIPNDEKIVDKEIRLTPQQVSSFFTFIQGTEDFPIFFTMVSTGMRAGEVAALLWSDIDFSTNTIHIKHNIEWVKGERIISTPKTKASIRDIPISYNLRTVLLNYQKSHRQDISFQGYSGFVFYNNKGEPFPPITFDYKLKRAKSLYDKSEYAKEQPIKHIYPHCLRHTFASLLLDSGVQPKTIQTVLGHTDIATTLNIYTTKTSDSIRNELEQLTTNLPQNTMQISTLQ